MEAFINGMESCFFQHGILFLVLILLNLLDWLTGWAKARIKKEENSSVGLIGIIRKVGTWIMVFIAFLLAYAFAELGDMLHIDMEMAQLVGWFVVLSLIVNEMRSILENLVECNVWIPEVLVRGLEAFAHHIDDKNYEESEEERE